MAWTCTAAAFAACLSLSPQPQPVAELASDDDALLVDLDDPVLRPMAFAELVERGAAIAPALVRRHLQRSSGPRTSPTLLHELLIAMGRDAHGGLAVAQDVALERAGGDPVRALTLLEAVAPFTPDHARLLAPLQSALGPESRLARRLSVSVHADVDRLIERLRNDEPDRRDVVATALARRGTEAAAALPRLVELLATADGDRHSLAAAILAVAPAGDPSIVPALPILWRAAVDGVPSERIALLTRLGSLGPAASTALDLATAALDDPDDRVIAAAVRTLMKLGPVALRPHLVALQRCAEDADDADTRRLARLAAQRADLRVDLDRRIATLLELLPDLEFGPGAKQELCALGPAVVRHLLAGSYLRSDARWLLADLGPALEAGGLPLVPRADIRQCSWLLQAAVRSPQSSRLLRAVVARIAELRDADPKAFEDELQALLKLGDDAPDDRLTAALTSGSAALIERAAACLVRRGERGAVHADELAELLMFELTQSPEDTSPIHAAICGTSPARYNELGLARAITSVAPASAASTTAYDVLDRHGDGHTLHALIPVIAEHQKRGDMLIWLCEVLRRHPSLREVGFATIDRCTGDTANLHGLLASLATNDRDRILARRAEWTLRRLRGRR